jgi:hypothetical protein
LPKRCVGLGVFFFRYIDLGLQQGCRLKPNTLRILLPELGQKLARLIPIRPTEMDHGEIIQAVIDQAEPCLESPLEEFPGFGRFAIGIKRVSFGKGIVLLVSLGKERRGKGSHG